MGRIGPNPSPAVPPPEDSLMLKKSASKEAFKANVKKEIASGKPQKQAVAIAYSVKRHAQRGK